jgi:hypothetical protein
MIKKIVYTVFIVLILQSGYSQNDIEVQGTLIVSEMAKVNSADSVVVRLSSGALGIRDVSSVRSGNFYLGQDTLEGIVYFLFIDQDKQQHGLIVSHTEYSGSWQSTTSETEAVSFWDGKTNTDQITDSPIKDYLNNNFESVWYIPSIDELKLLSKNSYIVRKSLSLNGHSPFSSNFYWSSTERSLNEAFDMSLEFDKIYSTTKASSSGVRPIRKF